MCLFLSLSVCVCGCVLDLVFGFYDLPALCYMKRNIDADIAP